MFSESSTEVSTECINSQLISVLHDYIEVEYEPRWPSLYGFQGHSVVKLIRRGMSEARQGRGSASRSLT